MYMERIKRVLNNDPELKELFLNNNNLGQKGAKYLSDALKINITLTTIYLGYNNLGKLID